MRPKIKFNPSKAETGSGLTSFASWDNPDTIAALESLFHIRADEQIDTVEITPEGITVRLCYRAKVTT